MSGVIGVMSCMAKNENLAAMPFAYFLLAVLSTFSNSLTDLVPRNGARKTQPLHRSSHTFPDNHVFSITVTANTELYTVWLLHTGDERDRGFFWIY